MKNYVCDGLVEECADVKEAEAGLAADFAETFLMHRHRGVINCDDHFILFGNDGFQKDSRSRQEAEVLLKQFADHDPILGVSKEGFSWAIVLTDYSRELFEEDLLSDIVWNAWMQACADEQQTTV